MYFLPYRAFMSHFYPRPPRGGRLFFRLLQSHAFDISIHALREEGDQGRRYGTDVRHDFYPRPPRGGRRANNLFPKLVSEISIHALREEGDRDHRLNDWHKELFLSTPSARRATLFGKQLVFQRRDFYPRPPRGGRRVKEVRHIPQTVFLSTPSARRATSTGSAAREATTNFYPRPPRGGRRRTSTAPPRRPP